VFRRYRFTFSKTGDARYLSHRQVMDTLERVLRAAGVPTRYTEGYNPHIRLSMGPALGVGQEGLAEVFDVDCTAPVRPAHLDGMNRLLPEGLAITDARDLVPQAPSLGKMVSSARYLIAAPSGDPWPAEPIGLEGDAATALQRWEVLPDGRLRVELNQRQIDGPTATVKDLLLALGVDAAALPLIRVTRERLVLRPRGEGSGRTASVSERAAEGAA
jgi:radical SAM-linked protein